MERRVIILGSTGSVGTQTLEVLSHLNGLHARGESAVRFRVVGLAAGSNAARLDEQCRAWGVEDVALRDRGDVRARRVRSGEKSGEQLVREVVADVVVAAMVGAAGLPATLAAAELGRDVALANKETLVAAGAVIVPAALRSGARLIPVDSEHSAVFQVMQALSPAAAPRVPPFASPPVGVKRVVLTASGGAFRDASAWPIERLRTATARDALKHPTWSMGAKVTIDTATLINKALELIEAHWLFGLPAEKLGALVHRQSIVHCLVEHEDGSVLAQLGEPDMRTPIQYALTWPDRPTGLAARLDLGALSRLDFEAPDESRFPGLGLAFAAMRSGGTAGAVLNAANEEAVAAFLRGSIAFTRIAEVVASVMDAVAPTPATSLEEVLAADERARGVARRELA